MKTYEQFINEGIKPKKNKKSKKTFVPIIIPKNNGDNPIDKVKVH